MRTLVVVGFILATAIPAHGDDFSCSFGKRGACLDFNDKVVERGDQCFPELTCYPSGFVCKSDLEDLKTKAVTMANGYDDFRLCVSRATEMADVQRCITADNLRR